MASDNLSGRLQAVSDSHKQTLHLIHRLQKLPAPPGTSSSDPDQGDARVELSAEIHQTLKEQEEELELLWQDVDDSTSGGGSRSRRRESEREQEGERVAGQVARLGEDLKTARAQFRKAQLQAKRNAEAAKRKERELLFSGARDGSNPPGPGRRKACGGQEKLTQEELEVNASSDVTAALRRTHHLMQRELSQSQFAHETLEQSQAALATLSESYSSLDTLLTSSRSLVSSLLRSQKSDTWYLETAFYILIATIGWLLFRRILYGPMWWLVYLPIKLLWRMMVAMLSAVGILGAAQSSAADGAGQTGGTSLVVQPSATGRSPTFSPGHSAPYMVVGGGGKGGEWGHRNQPMPSSRSEDGGVVEEVGRMAEESRQEQQRGGEQQQGGDGGTSVDDISEEERRRQGQIPRNPKKRMFEADAERKKMEDRGRKDEL